MSVLPWAIGAVRKAGNVQRPALHAALLEHIRAGRIDAKAVISHRLPLADAAKGYHMFANKQDDCLKCVLLPNGGAA